MTQMKANYPEGSVEGSLGWLQVGRRITSGLADLWFEGYEAKSVDESLSKSELDYEVPARTALNTSLVPGNEYNLIPEFTQSFEEMGLEYVAILESKLGPKILKFLDDNQMIYEFETILLLNDDQYIEIDKQLSLSVHLPWETYFGSKFNESISILKDSKGNEFCYFHSTVLYGTRPLIDSKFYEILTDVDDPDSVLEISLSEKEVARGVLAFDAWSTKINLPWLSKCLFYLGETPFPSSIMNLSRKLAFSDLDESLLPRPHVEIQNGAQVLSIKTDFNGSERSFRGINTVAPQQVQLGWLFTDCDQSSTFTILSRLTDALVKINSYLQDGYLNFNEPDSPFNFDGVVFSGNQLQRKFADKGVQGGYNRWIPITESFALLEETQHQWERLGNSFVSDDAKGSIYAWIGDEGAGSLKVASALNTAMFSIFLPNQIWGAFDFYAPMVIRLNVKDESTNAWSNWGIAYYLQGRFDMAIVSFEAALNRDDKYAEGEASFYLSKIYEKQGEKAKSEEYRKRCEAAGGYEATYL